MDTDKVGLAIGSLERRKTIRVVPLSWVVAITSVLFVLWNVVGYRLLDHFIDQKMAIHNGAMDAHTMLLEKRAQWIRESDEKQMKKLEEISERLARIEGALDLTNGNGKRK